MLALRVFVRAKRAVVIVCSQKELSTTVVLEVGHGILQPYHFNTSVLRFEPAASFDLELPKWHSLAVSEVSVMCLYVL